MCTNLVYHTPVCRSSLTVRGLLGMMQRAAIVSYNMDSRANTGKYCDSNHLLMFFQAEPLGGQSLNGFWQIARADVGRVVSDYRLLGDRR